MDRGWSSVSFTSRPALLVEDFVHSADHGQAILLRESQPCCVKGTDELGAFLRDAAIAERRGCSGRVRPHCQRASYTVTLTPCWPSCRAAIKPARPPPTTATRVLLSFDWQPCGSDKGCELGCWRSNSSPTTKSSSSSSGPRPSTKGVWASYQGSIRACSSAVSPTNGDSAAHDSAFDDGLARSQAGSSPRCHQPFLRFHQLFQTVRQHRSTPATAWKPAFSAFLAVAPRIISAENWGAYSR